MMPKHSPGKWRLRFTDKYSAQGAYHDIQSADGTVVASVIGTHPNCGVTDTTIGNLLLIQKSPDLLDFCKRFVEQYSGFEQRWVDPVVWAFLQEALALVRSVDPDEDIREAKS